MSKALRGAVAAGLLASLGGLGQIAQQGETIEIKNQAEGRSANQQPAKGERVLVADRTQAQLSAAGMWGSRSKPTYIRRPPGSVARDKRAARKRRNVVRAKRAGRGRG